MQLPWRISVHISLITWSHTACRADATGVRRSIIAADHATQRYWNEQLHVRRQLWHSRQLPAPGRVSAAELWERCNWLSAHSADRPRATCSRLGVLGRHVREPGSLILLARAQVNARHFQDARFVIEQHSQFRANKAQGADSRPKAAI